MLDKNIYLEILNKRPNEWNESFAALVYENVTRNNFFITNLAKCTQIDARYLPDCVFKEYLALLYKEIEIVRPRKIITFGNQVSSIFLEQNINVSKCRKQVFKKTIGEIEYDIYPIFYPVGNGMRNIDKAIEDLKFILENNFKL